MFENVPLEKLPEIKDKLLETLREIVDNEDIDMERMKNVINRHRLESLSAMEENPHYTIAFMVIGHMLYGNTKEDVSCCLHEKKVFLHVFNFRWNRESTH